MSKKEEKKENDYFQNFFSEFSTIIPEFSKIVFPQILFHYCLFTVNSITLFFISHKYKDAEMLNAIGISILYINISTLIIIYGIIGALDTLGSNAYGARNYKLMGIYFDRCRVIGFFIWFIICIFHFFFARKIINFLKVDERVIDLSLKYISIVVFNCLINIQFEINSKHLILIDKAYILLYISIVSLILHLFSCLLLISIFNLGIYGASLSLVINSLFNTIVSTYILHKLNLPKGSIVYFTKDSLKDWYSYLKIAIPGTLISGGEWLGYEIQGIFAIFISPLAYSGIVITMNIEIMCFPYTAALNSTVSMKVGDRLISKDPKKLKIYIFSCYCFAILLGIIVIGIGFFFGDYYIKLISPNIEIYEYSKKVINIILYYVFIDNAYYFFLGCLKAIGYLINPTIVTFLLFYLLDNCITYILAFKLKMEIKGIWISLSIGVTVGTIIFIYWIFSFDMNEMKEIALKRIEDDRKNLDNFKMDYNDNLIINFDDEDRNSFGNNRVEMNEFNNFNNIISNNNDKNKKKN